MNNDLLRELVIVSQALLSITEYECCDYGFDEAIKIAEKYEDKYDEFAFKNANEERR